MKMESVKVSFSKDTVMRDAGLDWIRLECFIWRNGRAIEDSHESFRSAEDYSTAVERIVRLLVESPELGAPATTV